MNMLPWWNKTEKGKAKHSKKKTFLIVILLTIGSICTGLGSNPKPCSERPATKMLRDSSLCLYPLLVCFICDM